MILDASKIVKECLERDEPVFVLRAGDFCARTALREYFDSCCNVRCTLAYRDQVVDSLLDFEIYKHKNSVTTPSL